MSDLPGLDLDAVARWLDAERPGLRTGSLRAGLVAGGMSNLTYRIGDGRSEWVLRRPPLAHVLPTAHDMAREYRVIRALSGSDVPVPEPVALCQDPSILGAPFYLMSYVDGIVLDRGSVLAGIGSASASRACEVLVDTLIALHEVEADEVGLDDFGHPSGFLARQLRRWHGQWQASQTRPLPDLDQVVERLGRSLPEQSPAAIVHGDYRLTNVIFRADLSGIVAVVDWEMSTLGDPLTDLGLLAVYQRLSGEGDFVGPSMPVEDGFLTADQMVDRYAAGSARNLDHIDWYVAFGCFKLAVIAEGIHHRYLAGKTVGEGFERFGPAVPGLLATALDTLTHR